jgi:hypothetical protein
MYFDLTNAASSGTNWNNTSPTSLVYSVGNNPDTNGSGTQHIAYCWSEIEGFSKFGSYTGNGSADGPFVYCGFKPRWIMVKRTDGVGNWHIFDTARDKFNPANKRLYANTSDAEVTETTFDVTANGFKLREPSGSNPNISGGTYIFAAFADSPINYANAR